MENFLNWVESINGSINSFVWGSAGIYVLLATGILMTILTKCFQITHIGLWMKKTVGSIFSKKSSATKNNEKKSISQFQALCTALAATLGVGNIAGVAGAIVAGGPGAVFWMWIAAFFGMMTNYSENVLGIFFRRKNKDGEWCGGAMYYLRDGLGSKKGFKTIGKVLAVLFTIFCIFASFGIGNLGQVNKIVINFESAFKIPALSNIEISKGVSLYALVIGLVLMVLAGLVILGGIKRIAKVAETIVPFMAIAYVLGALVVIGFNFSNVGAVFASIFKGAFGVQAVAGGFAGIAIKEVVTMGFKRGIFSNEAGLGSSVMVHSASNVKEPVRQGMWGVFEVFFDTIIVCTITALTILTSGVIDLTTGQIVGEHVDDATLVAKSFHSVFGNFGEMFIAIAVLLFAFTTVLGWSYYGTKAFEFLFGSKATIGYKIFFVLLVVGGAVMTSTLAWDISDTFNGLMMIPNLVGVIALSGLVVKITNNYFKRRNGSDVKPMLSAFPDVQEEQEAKLLADGE